MPSKHTFDLGTSIVARLAANARTAPGGESLESFTERAMRAADRVAGELEREGKVLVVSHGGILNYLLQALLELPSPTKVPFGFDHCGVVRVIRYREEPGFGSFPMLRFASSGPEGLLTD